MALSPGQNSCFPWAPTPALWGPLLSRGSDTPPAQQGGEAGAEQGAVGLRGGRAGAEQGSVGLQGGAAGWQGGSRAKQNAHSGGCFIVSLDSTGQQPGWPLL